MIIRLILLYLSLFRLVVRNAEKSVHCCHWCSLLLQLNFSMLSSSQATRSGQMRTWRDCLIESWCYSDTFMVGTRLTCTCLNIYFHTYLKFIPNAEYIVTTVYC